jgi:hypothetical protein
VIDELNTIIDSGDLDALEKALEESGAILPAPGDKRQSFLHHYIAHSKASIRMRTQSRDWLLWRNYINSPNDIPIFLVEYVLSEDCKWKKLMLPIRDILACKDDRVVILLCPNQSVCNHVFSDLLRDGAKRKLTLNHDKTNIRGGILMFSHITIHILKTTFTDLDIFSKYSNSDTKVYYRNV